MLADYILYHAAKSIPLVILFAVAGAIGYRVAGLRGAFAGGGLVAWPLIFGAVYEQAVNPSPEMTGRFIALTAFATFMVFYLVKREFDQQLTKLLAERRAVAALWILVALILNTTISAAISMQTYSLPLLNPFTESLLWGSALISLVAAGATLWRMTNAPADTEEQGVLQDLKEEGIATEAKRDCAKPAARPASRWNIIRPAR